MRTEIANGDGNLRGAVRLSDNRFFARVRKHVSNGAMSAKLFSVTHCQVKAVSKCPGLFGHAIFFLMQLEPQWSRARQREKAVADPGCALAAHPLSIS
jgi:hypothetical protein